ncbi:MAG: UDP-3-O-(3-hydroxymyristoyl)glucosamine N-acyltransferase [Steroidobacteraceae bacterium]
MTCSLGELAVRFGCELHGDPDTRVTRVATLAGGGDALGFVVNPAYRDALRQTRLGAVVLDARLAPECPVAALVHPNPHATFARIAALLHPEPPVCAGVHATAQVAATARIHPSAEVAAFAVIGEGVQIGPRCVVGPHCVLEEGVQLAADVRLLARVTLGRGTSLGERCLVHPGAVIGADGFGNARDGERWVKVPQVGSVRVGDDVEIGANTTIDRGALEDTVIGEGVRLDNQIQVGHNVTIGAHTAIAACTGIAGSAKIGARCMIGGGTGIGQVEIADDVVITGFGMVSATLHNPGAYSSVLPVEEVRVWRRIVGRIKRLDELATRVRKLEREHNNDD